MRDLKTIFGRQLQLKRNQLLCIIDVFTKYACVKPLKDKKSKTVLNTFVKIVNESNCKPNKIWVDQGRELYNKLMHEWLDNNDILIYSTHNEGKLIMAERFIKTLKAEIYKQLAAIDSKSYLPCLNKLVHQYKNTYHHSINKKPCNADFSAVIEKIETNSKAPKFKVNDRVRITKYKIFSVKVTLKIGQKKYSLLILFRKVILGLIN